MASRSVGVEPAAWLGADEGKNYLNSARSSEGDQAGRAADFIDSIDPKRTYAGTPRHACHGNACGKARRFLHAAAAN